VSTLEQAILRCRQAAEAAGYAAPAPDPDWSEAALRDFETVVHPQRLPEDLRTLVGGWHAGGAANELLFPSFAFGSGLARMILEDNDDWPRALVPIAYERHVFLLMELDFEGTRGPGIYTFEWAGDGAIQLLARSLDVVFEWAAEQFSALSAGSLPEGIAEIGRGVSRPTTGPEREIFDYGHRKFSRGWCRGRR